MWAHGSILKNEGTFSQMFDFKSDVTAGYEETLGQNDHKSHLI